MSLSVINKEKQEFAPVPAGVYNLRLIDIVEKEGQYGPYWIWRFEIVDHPYTGKWVTVLTDNNINANYVRKAGKLGPRDLVAVLTGTVPNEEEFTDGAEYLNLIGLPAQGAVTIGKSTKDGSAINILNAVLPPRAGAIGGYEAPPQTSAQASFDEGMEHSELLSRYLNLKRALGWETDIALEFIERWTERKVKFQDLSLEEKRLVIQWMVALDEEKDPPFNPPDDAPEMTAAGLVSPTVPAAAKSKK